MQGSSNTSSYPGSLLRRKACSECFKSKRRCDQRIPSCSRCRKLNRPCHYPSPPPQQTRPADIANTRLNEAQSSIFRMRSSEAATSPHLDSDLVTGDFQNIEDIDLGFLNEPSILDTSLPALDASPQANLEWLQSQPLAAVPLTNAVSSDLFSKAASRLNYAIELLKAAPSRMVLENSTPWSHALLYKDQMPKSMHDAHAACALYMARNDANSQMIFRAIDTRAKELLNAQKGVTPIENLARVQSLLLYQIIRLYDGDIRLRAQGEADMDTFELYSYALLGLLEEHGMPAHPPLSPPEASRSPFNSLNFRSSPPFSHAIWIFQESCRRTLLFSFFFLSFYHMLKDGRCAKPAFGPTRAWTCSAHLWNAPSEFDFKVAWSEKKHFIVQDLDFEEVLREAYPDDIDNFGKMFLVMSKGLDDIRGWFYDRGSNLVC